MALKPEIKSKSLLAGVKNEIWLFLIIFLCFFVGKPTVFPYTSVGFSLGEENSVLSESLNPSFFAEPPVITESALVEAIGFSESSAGLNSVSDVNSGQLDGVSISVNSETIDIIATGEEVNNSEDSSSGELSLDIDLENSSETDLNQDSNSEAGEADNQQSSTTSPEEVIDLNHLDQIEVTSSGEDEKILDIIVVDGENKDSDALKDLEKEIAGLTDEELIDKIVEEKLEELEKELEEEVRPDFIIEEPTEMKGLSENILVMQTKGENGNNKIWFYNTLENSWHSLIFEEDMSLSDNFVLKDNLMVWRLENENSVFIYNLLTKDYFKEEIPPFDPSRAEKGLIRIKDTPWVLIISNPDLTFFSLDTGEVFPDNNAGPIEEFRQKFSLDDWVENDRLSEFGLFPEEEEATTISE